MGHGDKGFDRGTRGACRAVARRYSGVEDKSLWFGQSPDGKKIPRDMTGQINQARSKLQQVEAHIASMKAKLED
jgi:hypothetical protein